MAEKMPFAHPQLKNPKFAPDPLKIKTVVMESYSTPLVR